MKGRWSLVVGRSPVTIVQDAGRSNRETQLLQFCGRQSYGKMSVGGKMPHKKKTKRFRAVQAVKELARERVGAPPTEKVVPHKKKNPEKHKPTLGKLLEEQ
jgi:hypothetical protein